MSTNRTAIAEKMAELLKSALDGSHTDKYYTNIYGNVSTKVLHFDQIRDFPFISIVKSAESPEYQPGGFRWNFLDLYVRIYVQGEDNYDQQLEELISDIKTFIDTTENFEYTITKPDGSSQTKKITEINWVLIGTDEGLLAPQAMGEIRLRVRYDDICAMNLY